MMTSSSEERTLRGPVEPGLEPHAMTPLRTRAAAWPNLLPLPVRFDPRAGILLAGSSRSGTTWLGQMISAAPGLCLVNEPFSPKMPGLPAAGFTWRTYRDPDVDWPEGEAVFRRVFSGRGVTLKLLRLNGLRVFGCGGLAVKAVRVNRLLPWLARRLDLRGIVVIVRHPCAVVSSQMMHFKLKDLSRADDLEYTRTNLPHLFDFARALATDEERRALTWSLDQHAALTPAPERPWSVISYEGLVTRGRLELERVFGFLGLEVPDPALRLLERNSWQARDGSVDHARASAHERLSVWRARLRPEQIERILAVVDACGIPGFGPDVLPDIERLQRPALP